MSIRVDAIRDCLEGAVPAVMATCAPDGTPNIAYLSQVQFIDSEHIALSFQFFNQTRRNVLANPHASLLLVHPEAGTLFRLRIEYLRTETSGPLFESMKAKLAGIASQTGMSGVFRLLGSDIYRVRDIETVAQKKASPPEPKPNLLPAARRLSEKLAACGDLECLFDQLLLGLNRELDIRHAMILLPDERGSRLFTVASFGYDASGIGSEIPLGQGVIGVAARERTPIRISHMTAEYAYSRAIRTSALEGGLADQLETEIPLPGLPESRSQLAVPIQIPDRLLGVLYVESRHDLYFNYDCEDVLVALSHQVAWAMRYLQTLNEPADEPPIAAVSCPPKNGLPLSVKHYRCDHSIFVNEDYLIKGVAGAILWKLLTDYVQGGRSAFSNRELRLDPALRLPDISDNLEARLILLQRRLAERSTGLSIEKTGRGRFGLCVSRPVELIEQ